MLCMGIKTNLSTWESEGRLDGFPVLVQHAVSEGRGNRQTILLARRAPTMKRWSLDARSEGQSGDSPGREGVIMQRRKQEALARANGTSREIDCEAIGG